MNSKCYKDVYQMRKDLKDIYKILEVLEDYDIKLKDIASSTLIANAESLKYFTVEYLVTLAKNAKTLGIRLVKKLCKPYWTHSILDNFITKFKAKIDCELLLSSCFVNDNTLEFALLEVKSSVTKIDKSLSAIDNVYMNELNLNDKQKCFLGIGLNFDELRFAKGIDNMCYLAEFIEGQINNTNFYNLKYISELYTKSSNRIIGYFDNSKIALVRSLQTIECELKDDKIISIFPILNKKDSLIGSIELNIDTLKGEEGYKLIINFVPENITEISYLRI